VKIAVTSTGPNLDDLIDERFARANYFIFVDTENMEFKAVKNEHAQGTHGVGPQAAQMLISENVEALITGNIGPNAARAIDAANIKVVMPRERKTVREAIEKISVEGKRQRLYRRTAPLAG